MSGLTNNARGILLMLTALACFVANDTMLKLVIEEVAPYLGVAVRGVFAFVISLCLVFAVGRNVRFSHVWQKNVVWRNLADLASILFFSIGIAYASLPAVTALSLLSPILVVIAARFILKSEISLLQWVLIFASMIGALMVAQPGGDDFNVYALLGLANAVLIAARDLIGRTVPAHIPALAVVVCSNIIVTLGAFVGVFVVDGWAALSLAQLMLLAGAGLMLTLGHYFIFLSFRVAEPVVVAPYFYTAAVFAVIYSATVFGVIPNGLAFAGIGVIVASGAIFVLVSDGRRRMMLGRR